MSQRPVRLTVGDTTTIVQRVLVPRGALVQPRTPTDSSLATLLGPPHVTREGDAVRIAFTVSLWAPGENTLVIPGAIVVRLDGRIDTLPDARVLLTVASVLPVGQRVGSVSPRQARPWVPRADRTLLPWAICLLLLLGVTALAWWRWRRRGPLPAALPAPTVPPFDHARVAAWVANGEARLALLHLEVALQDAPAAAAWSLRVAEVRYAPAAAEELAALSREGLRLVGDGLT